MTRLLRVGDSVNGFRHSPRWLIGLFISFVATGFSVQPLLAQSSVGQSAPPAVAASAAQNDKMVLAKVGDRELTVQDYRQFALLSGLGDLTQTPAGQIRLLRLLIEELLLDQALNLEELVKPEAAVEERRKAMASLQERRFPLPPPPDESAIRAYYEANREQFGIPELVRIVQIQFRTDQDKPEGLRAQERAEQGLQRILKGEDFSKVAAELTENPRSRELGPDRGFLPRNSEPWLRQALEGLKPGQRTDIVQSPAGYEILLITDWRAPLIADFAIVRSQVIKQIQLSAQNQVREAYVKTLAQKLGVKVLKQGMENANPIAQ